MKDLARQTVSPDSGLRLFQTEEEVLLGVGRQDLFGPPDSNDRLAAMGYGLLHLMAILLPSSGVNVFKHMAELECSLCRGCGPRLQEASYLEDPEGNGIGASPA